MTNAITTVILRLHGLVECGPCTCKDYVTETTLTVEDFKAKYSVEDLDRNFDLICTDIVDAATGHVLSEKEVRRILRKDLGDTDNMSVYYSREINVELTDHGNKVHAIMYWFNSDEEWPYDEWGVEVDIDDVKMMSEKDIEEAIKEKLLESVDREFNINELYFKWKVGE